MNRLYRMVSMAGLVASLVAGSSEALAQGQNGQGGQGGGGQGGPGGRGNFDPAQMRQRAMDRYKEQLGITDDAEWKIIQDRVEKVMAAQRDASSGRGFGMFGGGRPGGGGPGGQAPGGDAAGGQGGRRGGRGGFGGEPSPEAEALQKAIEGKASADELKAKLAKYRDSKKEADAKLEKAQEDLRKVLNTRQEAIAVLAGLLK